MEGYIKVHRKVLDNPVFQNEKALKIWLWLLLKANYKDKYTLLLGRQKVELRAGQLVFGSNKACEELKMSKSTIHFWLNFLEVERYIGRKKTSKFSLISILNWGRYQIEQARELDAELNDKRTLGVQINETNKKEKNNKKEEEEATALSKNLTQHFTSLCFRSKRAYVGSPKDEQRLRVVLENFSPEEVKRMFDAYFVRLERPGKSKVYTINAALSPVSISLYEEERGKDDWQY